MPPTKDSTVSGNAAREEMPLVVPQFVGEFMGNASRDSTGLENVARESAGFGCQEQDFRHAHTHELRDDEHFSDQGEANGAGGAEDERGEDEEEEQREDDRGTPFSSPHPMLPLWVQVLKKFSKSKAP
jgi:hypothetical protein